MKIPAFRGVTTLVAILVATASPALAQSTLYVARAINGVQGPSELRTVNPLTGATALVGPIGFDSVGSMDFHPGDGVPGAGHLYATGKLPGTTTDVLLTIDTATGQGTVVQEIIGAVGTCSNIRGEACPSIAFYNSTAPPLYALFGKNFGQIDRVTGQFSVFGATSGASPWLAMEFSPANVLYAGTDGEGNLAKLNADNGSWLGQVVVCPAGVSCSGEYIFTSLSFEPQSGALYAVMHDNTASPFWEQDLSLVTVDPTTGAFAIRGPLPDGVWALAWSNPALNTPVGVAVTVSLPPTDLTFAEVTEAGNTSLSASPAGPPPPPGLALGNPATYYDLSTTAVFSGPVTVCIDYSGITYRDPSRLRLFHFEGSAWVDASTSHDVANNIICGGTDSLSPFAAFEPAGTADTTPPRIRVPKHVQARAGDNSGAAVHYRVHARDDSGEEVTVVCVPPSGSLFPIGVTRVTCTATDPSGNSAQASFEVSVRGGRPCHDHHDGQDGNGDVDCCAHHRD